MADRLRVAIAGTGFGEQYAIGLKGNPDVELAGVFSRRPERAQAMAERFEIPFSTHRFEQLLKLPGLDAIAIVTPNSTHAQYVRAAVKARKHVICDKPLALSGEEAEALYEAAEMAGVRHVTFVPYRFSPAVLAMKQAMADGLVGRVVSVRARWSVDLRNEPLRWRFQRKLSGAGVVADLGAHIFDLIMWFAGPVRRVLGRCHTVVPARPTEIGRRLRPVDVPDECCALLEFADTGFGSVNLSWNGTQDQHLEIEGDRGKLVYHSPSLLQWLAGAGPFDPYVTVTRGDGTHSVASLGGTSDFDRQDTALAKMFGEIVGYLRGGERTPSLTSFKEGAEVLRVVDAVERSQAAGNWVSVSGPERPG